MSLTPSAFRRWVGRGRRLLPLLRRLRPRPSRSPHQLSLSRCVSGFYTQFSALRSWRDSHATVDSRPSSPSQSPRRRRRPIPMRRCSASAPASCTPRATRRTTAATFAPPFTSTSRCAPAHRAFTLAVAIQRCSGASVRVLVVGREHVVMPPEPLPAGGRASQGASGAHHGRENAPAAFIHRIARRARLSARVAHLTWQAPVSRGVPRGRDLPGCVQCCDLAAPTAGLRTEIPSVRLLTESSSPTPPPRR